ncbi:RagB/SusD family nutrient uptake outer membrane protein [Mucilaginibacter sp. CSA2-8R]|uniref:RagB/SusD family nutrient uptake outer membrane protein n=1 Tax=Mucilaginibacter sp. CSA2-8R TaxID=3141542 RepID=UPI00315DBF22
MFKHRLLKTLLFTVLTLSVTSCKKYLELSPQDGVTRDKFWKTKEQLQAAVIGCYNSMLIPFGAVPNNRPAPAESFFIWGEIRGDMVMPGIGATPDELNVINANILPSNTVADWRNIYRVINLCNTVLDFGPGVRDVDNTLTQEQLNAYLGEALTLRSLMYFYLVRSFGDAPLKLKSTSSDNELVQLAKTPQADLLKQIVADLKLAESYATASYGDNASNKGRITKFTVNALQADVYLWMDNYADCIAACDKIIGSGRYGLVAGNNANAWFNALFVTGNSNEGIFELQYDPQLLNPFYSMFGVVNKRYMANPIVIDEFFTVDPIDDNNKDIRGIDAAVRTSDQTIYKYVGINSTTVRSPDVSYAHWIVYRYADVLLMKAEACANSGRGTETLNIINTIRTRANALPASAQTPGPENVSGLTDYVLAERARELAYEGKRWYDLLRNAKRNNFARLDILNSAAVRVVPSAVQQSALNKLKDPNSLYFPIYQYEIQTDPNLIQNPFYK